MMMISYQKRNELERYANLCGDELGELCAALEMVASRTGYALTDGFEIALQEEIDAQLLNFTQHTKVVQREKTYTTQYEELEWEWEEGQ